MFRVEWEPEASDGFAAISMAHLDRWKDINSADNDIGKMLERDPLQYSQPVSEGLRKIICEPLAIYFSIDSDQVTVESVGWIET
jgi:hypothetical protein